jgi:hypothetical protein
MYHHKVIIKNLEKKLFFVVILKVTGEKSYGRFRAGSVVRGTDLDPNQNVMDLVHCIKASYFSEKLEGRYRMA